VQEKCGLMLCTFREKLYLCDQCKRTITTISMPINNLTTYPPLINKD